MNSWVCLLHKLVGVFWRFYSVLLLECTRTGYQRQQAIGWYFRIKQWKSEKYHIQYKMHFVSTTITTGHRGAKFDCTAIPVQFTLPQGCEQRKTPTLYVQNMIKILHDADNVHCLILGLVIFNIQVWLYQLPRVSSGAVINLTWCHGHTLNVN